MQDCTLHLSSRRSIAGCTDGSNSICTPSCAARKELSCRGPKCPCSRNLHTVCSASQGGTNCASRVAPAHQCLNHKMSTVVGGCLPACLPVCMYARLYDCLSVRLHVVCMSACCLSLCMSACCLRACVIACWSVCMSACLSVRLHVCPSACLPSQFACLLVCLPVRLSVCPSACLPFCMPVCPRRLGF